MTGVSTSHGSISCDPVVVAAGAWSAALSPAAALPVRPVKGQILQLRARAGTVEPLGRIVRTPALLPPSAAATGAWCSARPWRSRASTWRSPRVVCTACSRHAWEVLPEVDELELLQAVAGLRPGTPDNLPVIGEGDLRGLAGPTGHGRNGVLLAPLTGEAVAELLAGGRLPAAVPGSAPGRFAPAEATA